MERRTLLLGGAGALATVLAGCTGGGENDDSETTDDGKNDDGGDDGDDDIPGLDTSELDLDGRDVEIEVDGENDEELHIRSKAPEDDEDLEELLEELSEALAGAIDDTEKFKRKIETITVTIVDDGKDPVFAFYVDVDWAIDYVEGRLTDEEFIEKIEENNS